MNVYLEMGDENMKRNKILIGGAAVGVIAIVCMLALANTLKRMEKGRWTEKKFCWAEPLWEYSRS
jgi:hypothetical protein